MNASVLLRTSVLTLGEHYAWWQRWYEYSEQYGISTQIGWQILEGSKQMQNRYRLQPLQAGTHPFEQMGTYTNITRSTRSRVLVRPESSSHTTQGETTLHRSRATSSKEIQMKNLRATKVQGKVGITHVSPTDKSFIKNRRNSYQSTYHNNEETLTEIIMTRMTWCRPTYLILTGNYVKGFRWMT